MGATPDPSAAVDLDELRSLEASVLKALCLTINTAGSELKYAILDSVADVDFYFPINSALFRVLFELHQKGEYVIASNLDEELRKEVDTIPSSFVIDELFSGTIPGVADTGLWIARMKERGSVEEIADPVESKASTTKGKRSRAAAEGQQGRRQNRPVEPKRKRGSRRTDVQMAAQTMPSTEFSIEEIPVDMSALEAQSEEPPDASGDSEKDRDASSASDGGYAALVSEGEDWSDYLAEVASTQGKIFDTGFAGLDEGLSGLRPGLMLLVDDDHQRRFSFLKQLVDQVANASEKRGLYLASELPKKALRLKTLARLAAVPSEVIEKGRLKRDSPDWERIENEGRRAQSWLSRVFVHEMPDGFELEQARALVGKILSSGDVTCLVVVDSIEKAASSSSATEVVSKLKALADELDVLVLAATSDTTLLASPSADLAAVVRESKDGEVEMDVLRAGNESATTVRFRYQPAISRFSEA